MCKLVISLPVICLYYNTYQCCSQCWEYDLFSQRQYINANHVFCNHSKTCLNWNWLFYGIIFLYGSSINPNKIAACRVLEPVCYANYNCCHPNDAV